MTQNALTNGVHHIGLTVPDLVDAKRFFVDVLRYRQVGEKPDYPAVFVSDGTVMLTLWQVKEPSRQRGFDRARNVGLHHLALRIDDSAALEELHQQLQQHDDVEIEFAPEPLGARGLVHMMCQIPGGLRIEFVTAPQ